MMPSWPLVRLSDILALQRRWIDVDPLGEYTEIGIRSFGRGIFHKAPVSGASLGNKRVLRIAPGDLVFMNVFAWEGAVGVAGAREEGTIGSHRFATFTPVAELCDVAFLQLYFQTKAGRELLGRVSPGSAGRNRTMNLASFAEQRIPLPPLLEQRRIVTKVEILAAKISQTRNLRAEASAATNATLASSMRICFGTVPGSDWQPLTREVADIENGWSPQCLARPADATEWGVLKVGAVSFGTFDASENKALPIGLEAPPEYEIREGDFLMSRANTIALVGACAVVRQTRPRLVLCDKIFRFRFRRPNATNTTYWDYLMKAPALRFQIERGATGTSPTMKNISKAKILGLLVPIHDEHEQRRIVTHLESIQSKTDALRKLQEQTAIELSALLPSILDKAFNGEL